MASEQPSPKKKVSGTPSGFPDRGGGQWIMQAIANVNDRIESLDGKLETRDRKMDDKIGSLEERLRRIETRTIWIIAIGVVVVLDAGVAPGGIIFRVLQALASSG